MTRAWGGDQTAYSFPLRIGFSAGDPAMMANWFDYNDQKYLAAYAIYKERERDAWPLWVQEAMEDGEVALHEYWEIMIAECMADAWIRYQLKEYTKGLP